MYGWAYFTCLARLIAVDTPKQYHARRRSRTVFFGINDVFSSQSSAKHGKTTVCDRKERQNYGKTTVKER